MVFVDYKQRNITKGATTMGFVAHKGLVQGKEIQDTMCFFREFSGVPADFDFNKFWEAPVSVLMKTRESKISADFGF